MSRSEMTSETKKQLDNLVSNVEQIYLENIALKCLLTSHRRGDGKLVLPDWEHELQELMELPECQKAIAEQFVPLHQALAEAVDETCGICSASSIKADRESTVVNSLLQR
jgi:hypothetical protein